MKWKYAIQYFLSKKKQKQKKKKKTTFSVSVFKTELLKLNLNPDTKSTVSGKLFLLHYFSKRKAIATLMHTITSTNLGPASCISKINTAINNNFPLIIYSIPVVASPSYNQNHSSMVCSTPVLTLNPNTESTLYFKRNTNPKMKLLFKEKSNRYFSVRQPIQMYLECAHFMHF